MATNSINGNTLLQSGSFPPGRVASTGSPLNPATGGLLVVDGVQLVAGDRVLCKDEASAVNNGIYAASTGPWVRTSDAAGNQQFFSGMAVTVALGAVNAGFTFICTCTDDPVVVGTSNITWAAQSTVATATQAATSTSSLAIGIGSKTFTIPVGKAFQVGQWVLAQETSNSANQMYGQVTSYSGTSLGVNVTAIGGSGTHADWTIVLSNSAAAAGYQPPVGTGNVTGPGSSTAGHVATFADSSGKILQDGGAPIGGANTVTAAMLAQSAVAFGANMINGCIVTSVASSALTFAVKTMAGNDPSSSDPVWFVFRSATANNGTLSIVEVTAALSVTIPAGATLGSANGTPFRLWVVAVNNGSAVWLAVINCLSGTSICALLASGITNVTPFSGGGNSAQVLYGAAAMSNVPYSVIGYASYETGSTLATAGTYAAAPPRCETRRPGQPLPGQTLQQNFQSFTGNTSAGSGTFVNTVVTASITPISSANPIQVRATGLATSDTDTFLASIRLARGSTPIGVGAIAGCPSNNTGTTIPVEWLDAPASLATVTYTVQLSNNGAGHTASYPNGGGTMVLAEIMA
jgi:hypothetical protein